MFENGNVGWEVSEEEGEDSFFSSAGKVPLPGYPEIVVDYQNLLTLESMGEEDFVVPELRSRVNVKELLDGVELHRGRLQERDRYRDGRDRIANLSERPINIQVKNVMNPPEPSQSGTQNIFNAPVGSIGNQGKIGFSAGVVRGDQIGTQHNYAADKADLAAAAKEIQQLLEQLSQTYPTTTTLEQMTVVTKAVEEIERKPQFKSRIVGALKAAGTKALKEAIDHPVANVLLAAIAGWSNAKG